ncbi:hypothetical protein [Haladaptatus salinisoli]|nr:hypothetical protein [Haladaptatus salinisoli]
MSNLRLGMWFDAVSSLGVVSFFLGAGCDFALACDLRVMSEEESFLVNSS